MGNPIDVNSLQPFNLAGARAYTASSGSWPTGGFQSAIVGLRTEQAESGGAMFVLTLQAQAGKLAAIPENAERDYQRDVHGKTMQRWVTIPGTAPTPDKEEHYRNGMRGFLESMGFTAAQIEQNLSPAQIAQIALGRSIYTWHVEATNTHEGDDAWMTPDQWNKFQQGLFSGRTTSKLRTQTGGQGGQVQMPTIGQQTPNALANLGGGMGTPGAQMQQSYAQQQPGFVPQQQQFATPTMPPAAQPFNVQQPAPIGTAPIQPGNGVQLPPVQPQQQPGAMQQVLNR